MFMKTSKYCEGTPSDDHDDRIQHRQPIAVQCWMKTSA